jgi:NADH-quinone oxidoreductase subunit L
MDIGSILWLVPALPALGALINGARSVAAPHTPKSKAITNAVALGTTFLSAVIATFFVVIPYARHGIHHAFEVTYYRWIPTGMGTVGQYISDFGVDLGFQIDTLSATMLMVVCWVGFLIHLYATGYMSHEKGYTRFFTYLNLFMFMMLLLILGNNYGVMFVGWEGVGLCSYLLIGFYYDKNYAADAGKKAFITNRVGDFGFVLALFLIFNTFGTADFTTVFSMAAANPAQYSGVATAICLLLFVGACGKSAQIPLYVWLPDAMAGPTPVSALIHAATMVTAGVYMVVRSNVLFRLSPEAMLVVAMVGALTAIFAASIGLAQNDIKKVLAYSTVSQLGFMFIAAGVGAFSAAIFHVMTHAFFKACLFLGAGSVIHGCGGEQDMRKMGGLRKFMPKTHATFLIATLAIAGVPFLAGFFSKDEILASAFLSTHHFESLGKPLMYLPIVAWGMAVIAATFTAFYMFRLYFMTFGGEYRGRAHGYSATEPPSVVHGDDRLTSHDHHGVVHHDKHDDAHGSDAHGSHDPHESPWTMTLVLGILAFLSIIGGYVGLPNAALGIHGHNPFQTWLEPVLLTIGGEPFAFPHAGLTTEWLLITASIVVAALGIFLAWRFYGRDQNWSTPRAFVAKFPGLHRLVENKYYVDELYAMTVIGGTIALGRLLHWIDVHIVDGLVNGIRHVTVYAFGHGSSLVDQYVVDGAVNGVAWSAKESSGLLRRMQTGLVQNYALIMGSGVVLLALVYLIGKP